MSVRAGRMGAESEIDRVVREVLQRFGFGSPSEARWSRRVADLRWVLTASYEDAVERLAESGRLPLSDLQERACEYLPGFNSEPMSFGDALERISDRDRGPGVRVRISSHGRFGHPLRGFYHRQEDTSVIWVNRSHTQAAVAMSFAHEVGHALWDEVRPGAEAEITHPFFNAAYAEHLEDPREFCADAVATLGAYPHSQARRLFSRRGWPRSAGAHRALDATTVAGVDAYLKKQYGVDHGPASGLSELQRFRYLTSMIHFSKVRAAVLHKIGI